MSYRFLKVKVSYRSFLSNSLEVKEKEKVKMKIWGSIRLIFMNADGVDWMLMGLGLIGAIGDGFIAPIIFFFTGLLLNDIGGSFNDVTFMKAVSKVISFLSSFCS